MRHHPFKVGIAGSSPVRFTKFARVDKDKGRPAAFQADDRGVRLSLPAPDHLRGGIRNRPAGENDVRIPAGSTESGLGNRRKPVLSACDKARRTRSKRQEFRLVSSIGGAPVSKTGGWGFKALTGRQNDCSSSSVAEQLLRKQTVACSIQAGSTRMFNKEGGDR